MSEQSMNNFHLELELMEKALMPDASASVPTERLQAAAKHLMQAISFACEVPEKKSFQHLSDLIDFATSNSAGRREAAILTVRCLAIDGFLPLETDRILPTKIVTLIETGFADQMRHLKLSEKRQTFEKIDAIKGFHQTTCSHLNVLTQLKPVLSDINRMRADINHVLHNKQLAAYLQPFEWNRIKGQITKISEIIAELESCKDSSYKTRFESLALLHSEIEDATSKSSSFLSRIYVQPYVNVIGEALIDLKNHSLDSFKCEIETRRKPPHIAEKRYPLHQIDKLITITIPLINTGPGVAVDVTAELGCGDNHALVFENEEVMIGDIPPGEFALSLRALVVKPVDSLRLVMQLNWSELFGAEKAMAVDVCLTAQNSHVDWQDLEQSDPYSLEVAEGDRFVGRTAKVSAIGNRLLKTQMTSTYITGQKRIGKTSLAQAVLRYVESNAKPPMTYHTSYLEWGEYCCADALSTVRALGEQIYSFLSRHLPADIVKPPASFEGSLAPLNLLAKQLENISPNKRFIVVLDEFDEIHPEMYHYGPLAEVFFANLRTLSSRKNLALVLVGGEKMPFIIGSQGDQLNKFVREPLDYFSRSDEWNDYVELVTNPVKGQLNWEGTALNEIFTLTNGHPYYTKLICAKIFAVSVIQRDTEIIASDVRHALNGGITELDTNAFAHFWKDGINAEREESEVIELKRLRVLVALGRALRAGIATKQSIESHLSGSKLHSSEVGPIIEDFLRRDVMKDNGGEISMQLPIFQRWICEVGVTKLISSTLADDLESELDKANETAYVKSREIEELVKKWPLYRGHEITGESARAWLDQVQSQQEQRLLFKLLVRLRFVTTQQIAEHLGNAHNKVVARSTPPRMRESKVDKRGIRFP